MPRSFLIGSLSVVVFGLGAALSGCASDAGGRSADASDAQMKAAMMCPKCETVWVRDRANPSRNPKAVLRFSSKRQMVCPTCDDTAQAELAQDGLPNLHNCPECEVAMVPVTPAPEPANPKGPRR